jgi:hypothetical protein
VRSCSGPFLRPFDPLALALWRGVGASPALWRGVGTSLAVLVELVAAPPRDGASHGPPVW